MPVWRPRTLPRTWTGQTTSAPTSAGGATGGADRDSGYLSFAELEYAPEPLSTPQGLLPVTFGWTALSTSLGVRPVGTLTTFLMPYSTSLMCISVLTASSADATFMVQADGMSTGAEVQLQGTDLVQFYGPDEYTFQPETRLSVYATVTTGGMAAEVILFVGQGSIA